jgi:hypothetical protein
MNYLRTFFAAAFAYFLFTAQIINPTGGSVTPIATQLGAQCNSSGATGSGANDTTALQNIATTYTNFSIPAGALCRITGPITFNSGGGGLTCGDEYTSGIVIDSVSSEGLIWPAGANNPLIFNCRITRATGLGAATCTTPGTPTACATNIDFSGGLVLGGGRIQNVISELGYYGFFLGPAPSPTLINVIAQKNQGDGFYFKPGTTAGSGALQWQLINVLSAQNVGDGFHLQTVAGSGGVSFGQWTNVQTYANTGYGIDIECTAGVPCNGFRLFDAFLGSDGNTELNLNTSNTVAHLISGGYFELSGTGLTGPTLATAASGVGHGISLANANGQVNIVGVNAVNNSYAGIYDLMTSAGAILSINASFALNNGQNAGFIPYGISNQGTQPMVLFASKSGNTAAGTTQQYGVTLPSGANNNSIIGNILTGNATAAILNNSTGNANIIVSNQGWNPIGGSSLAATGSPMTYTASPQGETVYMTGGAVSALTVAGQAVTYVTANSTTINLGPNEQFVVTYTVAPTMVKSVH